jgi:hypothetical protein
MWQHVGDAGKGASTVMCLVQSARLNDIAPWHYLRDVMERLPTQPAAPIGELVPHRWQPAPMER